MEARKLEEREYHNFVRDKNMEKDPAKYDQYWSNRKFYTAAQKTQKIVESYLKDRVKNKRVLDYCCGNGKMSLWLAKNGASRISGIDLSEKSLENAKQLLSDDGLLGKCEFKAMDAENMEYSNDHFDVVYERGVLHHLDLQKAYSEIARTLKPDGFCLCVEALKHNPIMQWYRRKTPQLRTPWEVDHILGREEIESARRYFNKVEVIGYYYLFSLLAVPFRNTRAFNLLLRIFETIDDVVLRLPFIKWQAWHVVFLLSEPKKEIA